MVKAQFLTASDQRCDYAPPHAVAAQVRIADHDRAILLPERHVAHGRKHTAAENLNKVQLAACIEIPVHPSELIHIIRLSYAVDQAHRFRVLIPRKGKLVFSVEAAQAQCIVNRKILRLRDTFNRHFPRLLSRAANSI